MADASQISAWIALFFGLYLLAAGVGELRSGNGWWAMLKEFERSPGLRFVSGAMAFALGAAIYLVNPWRPDDWLSIAVSVLGGLGIATGLLILASGERYRRLTRARLGRAGRAWASLAVLVGLAFVLAALARLPTF